MAHTTLDAAGEFCPQDVVQTLQQINHRLGNMDNLLGNVNNQLGNVNNRLANVNTCLRNMDNRLGNVDTHLRNLVKDVRAIRARTDNLRIITRNKLHVADELEPLQKTVCVLHQP